MNMRELEAETDSVLTMKQDDDRLQMGEGHQAIGQRRTADRTADDPRTAPHTH